MTFVESETGIEYISSEEDDQQETVFILDEFEGPIYGKLQRSGCRLLGPTVFCKAAVNLQVNLGAGLIILNKRSVSLISWSCV